MTNKQLIKEYHYLRDRIDGIIEGGFGKYELYMIDEIMREMNKRNEVNSII